MIDLSVQISQADFMKASNDLENARSRIDALSKELDEAKVRYAHQRVICFGNFRS
jgi:hypothetical protein